jgi:hypothetical protein
VRAIDVLLSGDLLAGIDKALGDVVETDPTPTAGQSPAARPRVPAR